MVDVDNWMWDDVGIHYIYIHHSSPFIITTHEYLWYLRAAPVTRLSRQPMERGERVGSCLELHIIFSGVEAGPLLKTCLVVNEKTWILYPTERGGGTKTEILATEIEKSLWFRSLEPTLHLNHTMNVYSSISSSVSQDPSWGMTTRNGTTGRTPGTGETVRGRQGGFWMLSTDTISTFFFQSEYPPFSRTWSYCNEEHVEQPHCARTQESVNGAKIGTGQPGKTPERTDTWHIMTQYPLQQTWDWPTWEDTRKDWHMTYHDTVPSSTNMEWTILIRKSCTHNS